MNDLEFHVESLEQRKMLAGNVDVRVTTGGDLRIDGDNQGNEVVVTSGILPGQMAISGNGNTTINGLPGLTLYLGNVTDDVRINLRGGNNRLALLVKGSSLGDDLAIRTGNGSDVVIVDLMSVGDDVKINTGGGEDAVALKLGSADRIDINTGPSGDYLSLVGLEEVGRVKLTMGSGNDTIYLGKNRIESRVEVNAGSGDDVAFSFKNEFSDGLNFRGRSGDDRYFAFETTYGPDDGPERSSTEADGILSLNDFELGLNLALQQYTADDVMNALIEDLCPGG